MDVITRLAGSVCFWSMALLSFATPQAGEAADDFAVSLVQYPIDGNKSVEDVLRKMEHSIAEAVSKRSHCVVFPELMTFDCWNTREVESNLEPSKKEIEEVRRIAGEISPKFIEAIPKLAKKYRISILGGTTPRFSGDKLLNTAVFAFSDGQTILQDKIYPTRWEVLAGITGGDDLKVIQTSWGSFSILTCFDVEFPDISVALASAGPPPELLLVPSMTESKHGLQRVRWCAQARAVELHAAVAVCGTIGSPTPHWHHFGQAGVFLPRDVFFNGEPVLGTEGVTEILTAEVNLSLVRESREKSAFNPSAIIAGDGQHLKVSRISVK